MLLLPGIDMTSEIEKGFKNFIGIPRERSKVPMPTTFHLLLRELTCCERVDVIKR